MGTDDRQQVVLFQEGASGGIREEVRATSHMIVDEELSGLLLAELFQRICPKYVAQEAVSGRFMETIDLL